MQRRVVCITAILLCAMNAFADGVYIYRAKPPAIPSQRAIIVYKDGVERLQVESVVQSEGTSLAWILPVPATLTDIHEASPEFLNSLSEQIRPKIIGEWNLRRGFLFSRTCALILAFWVLIILAKSPRPMVAVSWLLLAAMACFVLFGGGVREAGVAGGVRVRNELVVGNYDVTVLTAPDAKALDAWLTQNGFVGLPQAGNTIANDYIKEGWQFVAAKLRTEAGQLLRPHPIELSFATKQPVYPMRLTALANCNVYVELYVIADRGAQGDRMTQQVVDTVLDVQTEPKTQYSPERTRFDLKRTSLDHPDASKYLWKGCAITRLDGTLSPAQMDTDITLKLVGSTFARRTYYTPEAKLLSMWTYVFWTWILVLAPATLGATFQKDAHRRRKHIGIAIALAALAAVVAGCIQASTSSVIEAYILNAKVIADPPSQLIERASAERQARQTNLGLATKTIPPPDLSNREALTAFLVQVKSQLQIQASAPNPGG